VDVSLFGSGRPFFKLTHFGQASARASDSVQLSSRPDEILCATCRWTPWRQHCNATRYADFKRTINRQASSQRSMWDARNTMHDLGGDDRWKHLQGNDEQPAFRPEESGIWTSDCAR